MLVLGWASIHDLAAERLELQLAPEASILVAEVDATAHEFEARVTQFSGRVSVDRETGRPLDGQLRFDFKDVTTGIERRDREMRQWLEYSQYPYAEASLVAVENTPSGATAVCRVRMHGREEEVVASISITRQDRNWVLAGEATIDHRRWGLPKIRRFLFLTVDPVLKVRFRLHFMPVEPAAER